jgi:hypothetical protein
MATLDRQAIWGWFASQAEDLLPKKTKRASARRG